MLTNNERTLMSQGFGEVFGTLNEVTWLTKTPCTEDDDDFGIHPSNCTVCGGTGYTTESADIEADVIEIVGDERLVVDAGLLSGGDLLIRTLATNDVQVNDHVTYKGNTYKVRFRNLDQLGMFFEIGANRE